MEAIFQVLNPNNTLTINRPLAHAIGLSEATVYAALIAKCSYYERTDKLDDGWFYSTVPDLEESTSLSEYQQKRCIANLVKAGLIESKNRGLPAKRSFRIIENIELLNNLIAQGSAKCDCIKPNAALSYEKKRKGEMRAETALSPYSEETTEQETDGVEQDGPPCSEETAEQAAEELHPLLQRNIGAYSEETPETLLLYKSKDKKSKENNQSINQSKDDLTDRIEEQEQQKYFLEERNEYLAVLKENIDYDCLIDSKKGSDVERVDEILNIILDVICSHSDFIRVNGENCPKEIVKSRFLKLNSEHIEYVLLAMDRSASDIRNIRSYLITALYNAPITMSSFYTAMVKYDFR